MHIMSCCFTWNFFLALPVTTSVYRFFFLFQNTNAILVLVPKFTTLDDLNVCFLRCDNIHCKLCFRAGAFLFLCLNFEMSWFLIC